MAATRNILNGVLHFEVYPSDVFYNSLGAQLFVLIAFMLFVVFLVVTSQHIAPHAPLRGIGAL